MKLFTSQLGYKDEFNVRLKTILEKKKLEVDALHNSRFPFDFLKVKECKDALFILFKIKITFRAKNLASLLMITSLNHIDTDWYDRTQCFF